MRLSACNIALNLFFDTFVLRLQKDRAVELKKNVDVFSGVANSVIGGGAYIHIFMFTDHKNNRFQKKLVMQNTNI